MGEISVGSQASAAIVAALRDRIDYLEAEVADLRDRLGYKPDDPRWRLIGLTKVMGRMVNALLAQRIVTRENMMHALYFDDATRRYEIDIKIVDVFICNLRKRLKPMGITVENVWGIGFRLAPGDDEKVRALLANAANGIV